MSYKRFTFLDNKNGKRGVNCENTGKKRELQLKEKEKEREKYAANCFITIFGCKKGVTSDRGKQESCF